ncbi:MAG: response regulator [Candidatus Hydrogenedentes bacterium]|nr:response regulator [Candidatus Hydrogenedentota bacterium]
MRSIRVCVADDNRDEVAILCESLVLHNYQAIPAYTGEEALRLCKNGEVDLLLLDIGLPDIDGIEVFKRLKSDPTTEDIPVIFVTARGSAEDVARGHELGAVDYITKPYNLPMVLVAVEMALRTLHTSYYTDVPFEFWDDPAYTDPMTGLRNYRFLMERLEEEIHRSKRHNFPISCVVLDFIEEKDPLVLDNDLESETFLIQVALTLRNNSRYSDVLARYEGTRFAILLLNHELDHAGKYVRKLSKEIEKTFCEEKLSLGFFSKFGMISGRGTVVSESEEFLGKAMRNLLKAMTRPGVIAVGRDLNTDSELVIEA